MIDYLEFARSPDPDNQMSFRAPFNKEVATALAENDNLIPKIQKILVKKRYQDIHYLLVSNLNLDPKIFKQLISEYFSFLVEMRQDGIDLEYKNPETRRLWETYLLLK